MNMIQAETVENIRNQLSEQGVDEATVSKLREQWPDIHFTYCSEDDIHSGKPVEETEQFSLYLVDSSEHCLCLTSDMNTATGLVIAEHYDDDDEED
ncbi:MAG: DUF6129 family protein [Granulosicoccaceae bacterium]|jgi:hypothetical protein